MVIHWCIGLTEVGSREFHYTQHSGDIKWSGNGTSDGGSSYHRQLQNNK